MRSSVRLTTLALLVGLWGGRVALDIDDPQRRRELVIDTARRELRVPVTVSHNGFTNPLIPMSGYHLLCWDQGRAAMLALLQTPVSDLDIQRGLEGLGASAGENLSQATWSDRADPEAEAPRRQVEGSRVAVEVLADGLRYSADQLVAVPGGRPIDARLGGHLAFRPDWRSGCILCLVSCPGGRLSNASYTMREYYEGKAIHELTPLGEELLVDGRRLWVSLRLLN